MGPITSRSSGPGLALLAPAAERGRSATLTMTNRIRLALCAATLLVVALSGGFLMPCTAAAQPAAKPHRIDLPFEQPTEFETCS
jgi:hypothetical protein